MTNFRYAVTTTPVGDALIALGDEGLVALRLGEGRIEHELAALSHELGELPTLDAGAAAPVARQLAEYFDGDRRDFDVELDWRLVRGFHRDALRAVVDIPYGETASYGEVAISAGRPGAARAVGTACRVTPFSLVVPVHRVIRADGTIGEYGARPEVKRFLIELENPEGLPR
ncbi:MAG TPA: methylated-DNA--[protein]-cysteine S-methyltransferase [Microbacterium sp.]|uniref:methylated-DNA--[protein]-cysteine S-methyltransferase n=1 Tax=Microbacterium sp. TaxID=51671 RepID=UPI002BBD9E20|nr:methylated-DNA--[protein]-cysteine S-methyltransferase [Microbacterium sp.]HWI30335.1 methylated-DNA--[protein]-cysteine S-methyltransferase [Microbacterium sp.]